MAQIYYMVCSHTQFYLLVLLLMDKDQIVHGGEMTDHDFHWKLPLFQKVKYNSFIDLNVARIVNLKLAFTE